jgi:death-on-curing protein
MTIEQVDFIHQCALQIGGGLHGTRDIALLESALARPQNLYAYGEKDTFQLAASYAEAIIRNHAFADGNKRTAFYTAIDFLEQNGFEFQPAKGQEHADMILELEHEKIGREGAATYLRKNSREIERERSEVKPTKKDWPKKPAQSKTLKKAPAPKRDPDRER